MPLATSDILFRPAATQDDTASNGGRMAATTIADGVKNALFPDVRQAERIAGSDKWRKLFIHFAPPDNSQALDVRVIPFEPTPASDTVVVYPQATHTDTQSTITASIPSRAYGSARVASPPGAGATSITVTLEQGAPPIFAAGDTVYITDKATIGSSTGSEEYATIASVAAPSDGTQTITLTTPLANGYSASVRVCSVIVKGDVLPSLTNVKVTSTGGTFDQNAVVLAPRSTIYDTWTVTFTTATAFSVSGATSGSVGSGTVGSAFAPNNASFGGPYFTLGNGAFTGTWQAGDKLTFTTVPAAIPLWLRRIVPANTMTYANNKFTIAVDLESA